MADLHIRWLIRRDMPEVLAIENNSFDHPWPEEEFITVLRQRNAIGMVVEHDDTIVGFMLYELHSSTIKLLNFATSTKFRRRGVGRAMIEKLDGKLSAQRRTRIITHVRETNLSAQLFFKAIGFRATSVLKNFYETTSGKEDAYLMQYRMKVKSAMQLGEI